MTWATCTDCPWRAQADDRWDAEHAAAAHYAATHVRPWCPRCDGPDAGPPSKRRWHSECRQALDAEAAALTARADAIYARRLAEVAATHRQHIKAKEATR